MANNVVFLLATFLLSMLFHKEKKKKKNTNKKNTITNKTSMKSSRLIEILFFSVEIENDYKN